VDIGVLLAQVSLHSDPGDQLVFDDEGGLFERAAVSRNEEVGFDDGVDMLPGGCIWAFTHLVRFGTYDDVKRSGKYFQGET
jgi:hypothetical protein